MTDADLLHALRDCYDSRLRRNIVDLGLVRRATLRRDMEAPGASIPGVPPRYVAEIDLNAPGTDDDANAQLKAQIANRLAGLEAISHVDITLRPALFSIL